MAKRKVVVSGDKGGVGKTSISALLAEWFIKQEKPVSLLDADPGRGLQTWIDKCAEKGRTLSSEDADIQIIDTEGTSGAGTKYIRSADVILVPFQPHIADLEVIMNWFLSIKESLQERVAFIPNKLADTKEQRKGLQEVQKIVEEEGRGIILPGLVIRNAVYPPVLNGRGENFFSTRFDKSATEEIMTFFPAVEKLVEQC